MSKVTHTPGRVVWRELMTDDIAKAKAFYGGLFGWTFQDMDMGKDSPPYSVASIGGKQIGGMMPKMPGAPMPTFWMSYVSVPDVDAAATRARELGGSVAFGPADVEQVGRLGTIMDADHAAIGLLHSTMGDPPPGMPNLGEFCWETLVTSDVERAKRFYQGVFGWQSGKMPGAGATVLGTGPSPEETVADVQKADGMPPAWLTYVVVETIEPARAKAEKLGAKVTVPLIEIPTVGRISFIVDPTGGHIGIFQPQMPEGA